RAHLVRIASTERRRRGRRGGGARRRRFDRLRRRRVLVALDAPAQRAAALLVAELRGGAGDEEGDLVGQGPRLGALAREADGMELLGRLEERAANCLTSGIRREIQDLEGIQTLEPGKLVAQEADRVHAVRQDDLSSQLTRKSLTFGGSRRSLPRVDSR